MVISRPGSLSPCYAPDYGTRTRASSERSRGLNLSIKNGSLGKLAFTTTCKSFAIQEPKVLTYNTLHKRSSNQPWDPHKSRFSASPLDVKKHDKPLDHLRARKKTSLFAIEKHTFESESKVSVSKSWWSYVRKNFTALYRFSRPHTVYGTVIGIISVSLLTFEGSSDLSPLFLKGLLQALVPSLLMNIYVVGLNQLFDIEIDKVNKPDLPLASGEFSMGTGVAIVIFCAFMSFLMGLMIRSPALLWALLISFLLGSVYSINLPFLRWKRFALLAASCILSVRAIVVQIAFYMHMQLYTLGRPAVFPRALMFATAFMCFFTTVIALFKDIPDVDGDQSFGIESFSVRLGQKPVFWLCINLLLVAYGVAMVVGAACSSVWTKLVTVLGHGTLAWILWLRARSLDLKSKVAITSFYMFIWKLFYMEYLLIPFVR
ncbi:hypothetical protein AMTRI_Chr12g237170 [Amborella trichopoda]|uniref:homogentisate phytyltransferase 1, chloroplastic n=1 Tax=Amborella trichopoda TaxID=13333 RepID=UPI0009C040D5|nr:homogentisate phytyltransferase 1, chloroplastic [Amborella trichopoda]|eukprot:XP_020525700.1 homogentisate phytyltransferase 1, chloroplastic [Amborella trichopoda]